MKTFIYTIIFVAAVLLPALIITTNAIKKEPSGKDYIVTYASGNCAIQYNVQHHDSALRKWHQEKGAWIPLREGMKTGTGDRIRTEKDSFVEVMKEGHIAFWMKENSLVELEQKKKTEKYMEVGLNYGKVICRVISIEKERFRVRTPTAVAVVLGTTFSVEYFPNRRVTKVEVLEGVVDVKTTDEKTTGINITEGKKIRVGPVIGHQIVENLSPSEQEDILEKKKELRIETSNFNRILKAMDFNFFSPILNKIMSQITESEMRTFAKDIKLQSRLRRGGKVPDSLRFIELEAGDYQDPWKTDYYYKKIGPIRAILISAGPDKILHTRDDIIIPITL